MYFTALHFNGLDSTALHCTALHCIVHGVLYLAPCTLHLVCLLRQLHNDRDGYSVPGQDNVEHHVLVVLTLGPLEEHVVTSSSAQNLNQLHYCHS